MYHSALEGKYGDGLIHGESKVSQPDETLTAIEAGPLDAGIAECASGI